VKEEQSRVGVGARMESRKTTSQQDDCFGKKRESTEPDLQIDHPYRCEKRNIRLAIRLQADIETWQNISSQGYRGPSGRHVLRLSS
jgi:hypothetical protein